MMHLPSQNSSTRLRVIVSIKHLLDDCHVTFSFWSNQIHSSCLCVSTWVNGEVEISE
ncbi:hypothetical protein V6Z11_D09G088100 [Gossypium hirsutum]